MNIRSIITAKSTLYAGLVLVIALFVFFAVQAKSKPEQGPRFGQLPAPTIKQIDPVKQPTSQTLDLGERPLPQTAKVYVQNPSTLSQDQIQELAAGLGFTPGAMQGTLLIAQEEDRFLMINPDSGVIFMNQPLPEYLLSFSQDALESFASTLAAPTFLEENIWQEPVTITTYYKSAGAHEAAAALPSDADSAEVNIFPTLEGKRIIGKDIFPLGEASTVTVKYFKEQKSASLRTSLVAVNFAEFGTYPLKPLEQVKQEILRNQTVVTAIIPEGRTAKDARYGEVFLPTAAKFTDIELVFYFDPSPGALMQPMFLVTGTTTLEDGTPATIKAILPAIDPQFLQTP